MFLQALIILNYHITALTNPDLLHFYFYFYFPLARSIQPLNRVKRAPLVSLRQDKFPLLIGHALPELGLKAQPSFYRCLTLIRKWISGSTDTARGEPIRTGGYATWADRASFKGQTNTKGFTTTISL